jgi:hypothetical protein
MWTCGNVAAMIKIGQPRHPREGGDPESQALLLWIPAFAGMTCFSPYLAVPLLPAPCVWGGGAWPPSVARYLRMAARSSGRLRPA